MGAETVGVVALDASSVREEIPGSTQRDRARNERSGDQREDEREKDLASASTPHRHDQEHHSDTDGQIGPGPARVREDQAKREEEKEEPFQDAPEAEEPGSDGLLHVDEHGGDEERAEDIRILEERMHAVFEHHEIAARKRQEERQQTEGRRERGRGDVAAGRHLGSATVCDPAREPEGKDGDVGRRGEEGDGALVVHDLDRRHEVEREEDPDDSDGGSWNALNAEAARGERDRNDDEEHEIRRRGLDDHDPEQREPESRSSLLPDECERQDRDEAEARGGRKLECGRVARKD